MRWAQKKPNRTQAWELGAGSAMEKKMISDGLIVPREGGRYELFSLEAVSGRGQSAQAGDYFKVDGTGHPYPNARAAFQRNHTPLGGDWYEQRTEPVPVWMKDDPACEEISFLTQTGRLSIHPENPERYFSALLWGTLESAADTAAVVFYSVSRDSSGRISAVEFNFVEQGEFRRTYELLAGQPPFS